VVIDNGKIKNYQAVVPTTWNASPRDEHGTPGPYEASLSGNPVANAEQPREMLLIGIVPENVKFGPGLSASVKSAIPPCVDRVVAELAARGAGVTPRMPALEPDLWWEVPLIEAA
jgi:hypothetical protein